MDWFLLSFAFSAGVMVALAVLTLLGGAHGLEDPEISDNAKFVAIFASGAMFCWAAGRWFGTW
jgi:hypothetical protein